jgi:hypothetical protein
VSYVDEGQIRSRQSSYGSPVPPSHDDLGARSVMSRQPDRSKRDENTTNHHEPKGHPVFLSTPVRRDFADGLGLPEEIRAAVKEAVREEFRRPENWLERHLRWCFETLHGAGVNRRR